MPQLLPLQEFLDCAITAAVECGKISLEYFQTTMFDVEQKEDNSPVTIADRRGETRIREIIRSRYPDHGIIGEEGGETTGSSPIRWILDPIDGTKNFIRGVPLYGVLIGVEVEGRIEVGVAHFPALGETYYASRDTGSFCNGRRIAVSTITRLSEAALLYTDPRRFERDALKERVFRELGRRVSFQRSWGDCYGHILVASGRAEIMLDPSMKVWDCAPLQIIVEEAGGIFTDWKGVSTIYGGDAISTNGELHKEVMEIIEHERR